MFEIHKLQSLGKADCGWLKPRYHFSFSNYYNPHKGFDPHPHKDMENVTYIVN